MCRLALMLMPFKRAETVQEKIEGEKREIVREAQQRQHELQV